MCGRTIRLTFTSVLPREQLGEFALRPQQTAVRALFVPLRRIQRDLDVRGKVNTVLIAGGSGGIAALRAGLSLDDLGVHVSILPDQRSIVVETASGILTEPVERAARHAGENAGLGILPVFTYLANTFRKAEKQVPYSLITALDLGIVDPDGARHASQPVPSSQDAIVLNSWTARELSAGVGDRVDLDYYLWDPEKGLTTASASFKVRAIVPIEGLAADRRLAPDYPGITGARSLADWDPPFPIDLSRIRREDEHYWDEHNTTPKAFISYERGREMWGSQHGQATSIRLTIPEGRDAEPTASSVRGALLEALSPASVGVALLDARRSALEASSGATDFGEYFTYFSIFLVVSALLLALLFFKLGVEQRLRQIGVLQGDGISGRDHSQAAVARGRYPGVRRCVARRRWSSRVRAADRLRAAHLVDWRGWYNPPSGSCDGSVPRVGRLRWRHFRDRLRVRVAPCRGAAVAPVADDGSEPGFTLLE